MKPRIDISKSKSFTAWESGGWDAKKNWGLGVIVSGENAEKLPVIFDVDPAKYVHQYCFHVNVDYTLASCFITKLRQKPDCYSITLELAKVVSLSTKQVQVDIKAHADLRDVWITKQKIRSLDEAQKALDLFPIDQPGILPVHKELLKSAIDKALLDQGQQRLFWGIERKREESYG